MGYALRPLLPALFGLTLFAAALHAQASDTVLDLPADWQAGETYRLERVMQREQYQGEAQRLSTTATTRIDVTVLRKLESGYVIRWTYGRTELPGGAANDPFVIRMANLTEGMRLDMQTDALGSVTALVNGQEVVAHYRRVMDATLAWMKEKGASDADMAQVRAGAAQLMDPATVELLAVKEPTIFYAASGGTYQLGEPQAYEDLLPNPLGGRPLPSKAHFLLSDLNRAENRALVEWRQTIDPDQAAAILRESLMAVARRMNRPPPAEQDLPLIQVEDQARFLFDTATGRPLSVNHERTIAIGPNRRIDRLTIRVVEGE